MYDSKTTVSATELKETVDKFKLLFQPELEGRKVYYHLEQRNKMPTGHFDQFPKSVVLCCLVNGYYNILESQRKIDYWLTIYKSEKSKNIRHLTHNSFLEELRMIRMDKFKELLKTMKFD